MLYVEIDGNYYSKQDSIVRCKVCNFYAKHEPEKPQRQCKECARNRYQENKEKNQKLANEIETEWTKPSGHFLA